MSPAPATSAAWATPPFLEICSFWTLLINGMHVLCVDFFLFHVHVFKVHPCCGGLSAPSVSEAEAYNRVCYPLILGWVFGLVPHFGHCESCFCEYLCTVLCLERFSVFLLDT